MPFSRPARASLLVVLALLVPACGGGGGGGGDTGLEGSGGPPPPPPVPPEERARAILEGCVLEAVEAFEGVAARFDGTLDGEQAPTPDFRVTGVDLLSASLTWTLDADADAQVDLQGTMRFTDAGGSPAFPFSPATVLLILAGTADVPSLLATLPDGTGIAVEYETVGLSLPVEGTLATSLVGGMPTTVDGDAFFDGAGCDTRISFEDVPAAALYAENPTATFDVLVTATEGTLQGTVTLNGDGTATIDVILDGTDHLVWSYDLATGTLTLVP
jgi:hypothetical protein